MDRYKVSPAYKKRVVTPRYVWITTGMGTYTNEKSAEFIAKKNAGINEIYYDQVAKVEKVSFKLCDKEEFVKVAHGNKVYMYGDIDFADPGKTISGCVSTVVAPEWGCITFGVSGNVSLDRLQRSNLKEMHYAYENLNLGILPQPVEATVQGESKEDNVCCIVVAAMIVE